MHVKKRERKREERERERERGKIFEKERWKKIRDEERLTEREKSCLEQTLPLSSVFFTA